MHLRVRLEMVLSISLQKILPYHNINVLISNMLIPQILITYICLNRFSCEVCKIVFIYEHKPILNPGNPGAIPGLMLDLGLLKIVLWEFFSYF